MTGSGQARAGGSEQAPAPVTLCLEAARLKTLFYRLVVPFK